MVIRMFICTPLLLLVAAGVTAQMAYWWATGGIGVAIGYCLAVLWLSGRRYVSQKQPAEEPESDEAQPDPAGMTRTGLP